MFATHYLHDELLWTAFGGRSYAHGHLQQRRKANALKRKCMECMGYNFWTWQGIADFIQYKQMLLEPGRKTTVCKNSAIGNGRINTYKQTEYKMGKNVKLILQ